MKNERLTSLISNNQDVEGVNTASTHTLTALALCFVSKNVNSLASSFSSYQRHLPLFHFKMRFTYSLTDVPSMHTNELWIAICVTVLLLNF